MLKTLAVSTLLFISFHSAAESVCPQFMDLQFYEDPPRDLTTEFITIDVCEPLVIQRDGYGTGYHFLSENISNYHLKERYYNKLMEVIHKPRIETYLGNMTCPSIIEVNTVSQIFNLPQAIKTYDIDVCDVVATRKHYRLDGIGGYTLLYDIYLEHMKIENVDERFYNAVMDKLPRFSFILNDDTKE